MIKHFLTLMCAGGFFFAAVGCDVEQTSEGELPTVDVDADPGKLPEFDVDAPEVDVQMKEKTMKVPDVDVEMKDTTVEVPDIDIDLPADE
ncbi:hypothetical protein NHH03_15510 [Stieleria sp. TO1_6]|uniref:hypothetical protein n=1 Tax=Stieleria tagensis TaxID=2956795 RepID=UPI00209B742C|nr:hypothetical protein [Stieleria tagensis]MCO8123155.1 hypothetical protein [Stieleria tagensis]